MSVIDKNELYMSPALAEYGLEFREGYSEELAEQILINSQQESIRRWAIEDSRGPFRSMHSIEEWATMVERPPLIVSLGAAANKLAAVAWITSIGCETLLPRRQFGIRVYEGYQEKGIGTVLGAEIPLQHAEIETSQTSFDIANNNNRMFALGTRLGYRLDNGMGTTKISGRMTMVKPAPDLI